MLGNLLLLKNHQCEVGNSNREKMGKEWSFVSCPNKAYESKNRHFHCTYYRVMLTILYPMLEEKVIIAKLHQYQGQRTNIV